MLGAAVLRFAARRAVLSRCCPSIVRHGPISCLPAVRSCVVSACDPIGDDLADLSSALFHGLDDLEERCLAIGRLQKLLQQSEQPSREALQKLLVEKREGVTPRSFISFVADAILERNYHLRYSAEDLFTTTRAFRFHPKLSSHPLLLYCLTRLEIECQDLPIPDVALLVLTVSYLELLRHGNLTSLLTKQLGKNLSDLCSHLISAVVETLARGKCLPIDFGDLVVERLLVNSDQFSAEQFARVTVSLSKSGVKSCAPLVKMMDEQLMNQGSVGGLSEQMLCEIIASFVRARLRFVCSRQCFIDFVHSARNMIEAHTFVTVASFLVICCGVNDADFQKVMQLLIQRFWPQFLERHLALLARAVGKLDETEQGEAFAKAFARRIKLRIYELSPEVIVMVFFSFYKDNLISQEFALEMAQIALRSLSSLPAIRSIQLFEAVGGVCEKSLSLNYEHHVRTIGMHVAKILPSVSPRLALKAAMSLNMMGFRHPVLLRELGQWGLNTLLQRSQDTKVLDVLSVIAMTLSRLNFAAANFFVELHNRLETGMLDCTPKQLVELTWACVAQGAVPFGVLRSELFNLDLAPTGGERLRYLQIIRDLHVLCREEFNMQGFADEHIVKMLYDMIQEKQAHFAIPVEAATMLKSILGEDCVWTDKWAMHGFTLPAALLFNVETGAPVPWKAVGADPDQTLPCAKVLASEHKVHPVAVLMPTLVRPELAPGGATVLMLRLLRACGWKVAMLPKERWSDLPQFKDKVSYLKQLLLHTLQ